jgi:hypothetical protein
MSSTSARDDTWYAKAAFGVLLCGLVGTLSTIFGYFRSDIGALARRALMIVDRPH